jgi:hypothetical protein
MTRTASFDVLGSEFNDFLYASIAPEDNGMTLSVLSALARLGFDPWEQAALWARQPQETARGSLAALLAALPHAPAAHPDPEPLAARLIALLPRREEPLNSAVPATGSSAAHVAPSRARSTVYLLVYLVLSILMVCSHWIFRDRSADSPIAAPTALTSTRAPAGPIHVVPVAEVRSVTPPGS